MQSRFFANNFGSRDELQHTGEVAVAFNGATSPIWGTFNTEATFQSTPFPIAFKVIEGSQYEAILGLDFLDKHAKSIEPLAGRILLINGETVEITKRSCDADEQPVLCCSIDTVVPPQSRSYIPCTVIGVTSSPSTILCLDDALQFTIETGLLVAHSTAPSNDRTYAEVVNISNASVAVKRGSTIGTLEECERIPYSINKQSGEFVVNRAWQSSTDIELSDVGVDTAKLDESEQVQLKTLLNRYRHVFSGDDSIPGRTSLVEHHIDLKDGTRPFKLPARRIPMHLQEEADKEVQKMIDHGIVEPSNSEFSSPPVLVRKKDGTVRFCIDYRKLNEATVKDSYPLPRISEAIDSIGTNAKYFSSLDLAMGYHHVPIAPEDKHKTAFPSRFGLLQYTAMPFGLTNAPATFQRLMERVLSHMNWKDCLVYIDDVLIWSQTFRRTLAQAGTGPHSV